MAQTFNTIPIFATGIRTYYTKTNKRDYQLISIIPPTNLYYTMKQIYAPFAKPLYVMTKPIGSVCNLACNYCYYLEKTYLYKDISKHVMSEELLDRFIKEYISSQTMPQV